MPQTFYLLTNAIFKRTAPTHLWYLPNLSLLLLTLSTIKYLQLLQQFLTIVHDMLQQAFHYLIRTLDQWIVSKCYIYGPNISLAMTITL
jgi:hypothetical protein